VLDMTAGVVLFTLLVAARRSAAFFDLFVCRSVRGGACPLSYRAGSWSSSSGSHVHGGEH
jgi:hypothetical protein